MNKPTARLLLASVLMMAAGCAQHNGKAQTAPPAPEGAYTVAHQRVFTPEGWPEALAADIYLPTTGGQRAAVLLVHGGGWERRSREDMEDIARHLAARGFVVMNASYRFAPRYTYPAQILDLREALHWLRDHAGEFGVDPQRIGAYGYSAGAHLVSLLALEEGESQSRLRAVVAGGTPTDLRRFADGELVPQFLGGSIDDIPEIYREASPLVRVHAGAPPFFLYHGTWDRLVPIEQAADFKDALAAAGVDAELYRLPLRGHVAAFLFGPAAIRAATEFLQRELRPGDTSR